jgi:hypothetical protein
LLRSARNDEEPDSSYLQSIKKPPDKGGFLFYELTAMNTAIDHQPSAIVIASEAKQHLFFIQIFLEFENYLT